MNDDFKVGRRARRLCEGYSLPAIVAAVHDQGVRVIFESLGFEAEYSSDKAATVLLPLCDHCNLSRQDHADNGKCLYGPWSWE